MHVCPRGSPHTAGFLIVEYLRFAIWAPPTFFRVDSVTLNTPHTSDDFEKILILAVKCCPIIKCHMLTGCNGNKCHEGKVSISRLGFHFRPSPKIHLKTKQMIYKFNIRLPK